MKADLHNHLGSNGANPGFDETIDFVHKTLGHYSMFGIADSDDLRYERFVEQEGKYEREIINEGRAIYVPKRGVLAVKCQEMFTKEGHILAIATPYGKLVKTKDAKDAIKEAKDLGGILVAVHPFYYQGIGNFLISNNNLISQFSSWEVYNGSAEFSFPFVLPAGSNKKANEFYEEMLPEFSNELGMSSFTDGHSVDVVGKCYTDLPLKEDFFRTNFIENLNSSLRNIKVPSKLHMEQNISDAAIHAFKMGLVKLGLRSD
jgi:hypothetical protein